MINIKNKISIDRTNYIKGLLIILIIIGHTKLLSTELRYVLYSFHVIIFFLLPFLYINYKINLSNVIKLLKRVYIPFLIFYTFCFFSFNLLFKHSSIDFILYLKGLIINNSEILDNLIGIKAYWFFPTYILIILLMMIYNSININLQKILFLILLILHFFIPTVDRDILIELPYNAYILFYIFSLGIISRYFFNNYNLEKINIFIVTGIFLVCAYIIYGTKFDIALPLIPNIISNPLLFLIHDIFILCTLLLLILLSKYNNRIISGLGIISIAIYTIHPIVIQLLKLLITRSNILTELIIFLLTLSITLITIFVMKKIKIYEVIYPK
jgi:fucose 4-O-acetylase-like acetyltransferase